MNRIEDIDTFEIGSLVECVNPIGKAPYLRYGQIYTIAAIDLYGYALYLDGLSEPYSQERFQLKVGRSLMPKR